MQVVKVAAGSMFAVALTQDQQLWSWGFEECNGRLGKEDRPTQVLVGDGNLQIIDVACSEYATACIDCNGGIWVWGAFRVVRN